MENESEIEISFFEKIKDILLEKRLKNPNKIENLLLKIENDLRTIEITKDEFKYERIEKLRHYVIKFMKKNYLKLYEKWIDCEVN